MTIPNLGGNSSVGKIKIHESQVQQPNVVQEHNEEVIEPKSVEPKEYSVAQFEKDYSEILTKRVLPSLLKYESERKTRLAGAITLSVILVGAGLWVSFCLEGRSSGDLAAALFAAAGAFWALIRKNFENKLKKKVMPLLMRAIPRFYWQKKPTVTKEDITISSLFPKDNCSKTFDDCFIGDYKKVPIAISETYYSINHSKHTEVIFRGVVIKIKMNKNFEGKTVIRTKSISIDDLKKQGLSEVTLEDSEFNKMYRVYSTDQIEARYLLTTAFMERFKQMILAFSSVAEYCSFVDDSIYLGFHTGVDMFAIGSLTKPVTDIGQFKSLFHEIVSILELVDHFKLDKKLGL
jgi:hypothetical protein